MSVILSKGQACILTKANSETPVINVTCGASWGKISKLGNSAVGGFFSKALAKVGVAETVLEDVDLDLSVVCLDQTGQLIDVCYFAAKKLFNGAILHSGDDLVGSDASDGTADNERIKVEGMKVPSSVAHMFMVVNSFRHQKFDAIPFIQISLYDGLFGLSQKAPRLLEFALHNDKAFAGAEAAIMARISRTPKGFEVTAIGKPTSDRTIRELAASCQNELR